MFRKPFRILAPLAFASLFAGCATYQAEYDILEPATRDLPFEGERILVVDRHWHYYRSYNENEGAAGLVFALIPPLKKLKQNINNLNQKRWQEQLAQDIPFALSQNFTAVFDQVGKYKVDVHDERLSPPIPEGPADPEHFPEPLDQDTIDALVDTYQPDYIIAFEKVFITTSTREESTKVKIKDKNGKESEEDRYDGHLRVVCSGIFRIYDPVSKLWIDQQNASDEEIRHWGDKESSSRSAYLSDYEASMAQDTLFGMITNYAESLTPHYSRVSQRVFVDTRSAHKERLIEAAKAFETVGSWKDAIPIWQEILPLEQEGSLKAKLLLNLSLAAERQEDFALAVDLAEKAVLQSASHVFESNLRRLKQRLQDYTTALSQLP